MAFEGDLSKLPLGDVCQTLVMTRQHGILVVRGPDQRRISIDDRGLALIGARASMGERVARYLLATGGLDVEGLAAAEKVLRRRRSARMDEVLQSECLVAPDVLRAARAYVAQEEIFEMFLWREGTFALLEGRREDGGPFSEIAFDIGAISMEAARRIDESTALDAGVPLTAVLAPGDPASAPQPHADGEAACRVFDLVDSVDSVREIVLASHLGEFDTRKSLEYLLQSRALRHAEADEIADAAEASLSRDSRRSLALFDRLTELCPDDEEAWRRSADAHRRAGDRADAATRLVTLAGLRARRDQPHLVVDALRSARDLAPELPHVHEHLVSALLTQGDFEGAVKAARAGVARCAEIGAHDTIERISLRALEHAPDDPTLLVGLAASLQATGRTSQAVRHYDAAAVVLARSKRDRDRLADVLRRLIRIAPDSKEYEKRLADVQREKNEQRRRARFLAMTGGAVLVVAGVALPLSLRESSEERFLRVHSMLDKGEFESAMGLMDDIEASDSTEDAQLQLRVLRGIATRGQSGVVDTNRVRDSVREFCESERNKTDEHLRECRLAEAIDSLAEASQRLQEGVAAELRNAAPEAHAAIVAEFARDASSTLREIRDKARSKATEAEDVVNWFRLSAEFQRARLKVDSNDDDALAKLAEMAAGVESVLRGTDWDRIVPAARSLVASSTGIDGAPLDALEQNVAAFLLSADMVVREGHLAEAYSGKIRIFREFRDARTRGLELARTGKLEEALDLHNRFLETCGQVRDRGDDDPTREVLLSFLESMPIEETITAARNELRDVIEEERGARAAAESGRDEEAFARLSAIVRAHPTLGFAGRFLLPLSVRTSPPGAEILLADTDEVIGHTPARIEYSPDGETRFVLRAPGYEPEEILRGGARKDNTHLLDVVLQKKSRWRASAGAALESHAAVDATNVYVSGRNGIVRSFARANGSDEGRFATDLIGGFAAAPAVLDGHVFVVTVEGAGFVLRAGSLREVARFTVGRGVRHDLVAMPSGVLVCDDAGGVTLVNTGGQAVWTQNVGMLVGSPVPTAVGVAAVTTSGQVVLLDASSGRPTRRIPLGASTGCEVPAVRGATLYTATHDRGIVAVDLAGGSELWRREVTTLMRGRPAPTPQGIAWLGSDGAIHVFDRGTGAPLRVLPLDGPAVGDLLVLDDDVVVTGSEGAVRRLRADGSLVWFLDTGSPLTVAPALGSDAVIITGHDGLVLETRP